MTIEEAYRKASAQCAAREYCRHDWLEKLRRAKMTQAEAEAVVARLVEEGFIDEGRYARAFVHDKTAFAKWGRVKTRLSLKQKGIPAACIEEALQAIDEAAYLEALADTIRQKACQLKDEDPRTARMKTAKFAISRGYEPQLAFEAAGMDFSAFD